MIEINAKVLQVGQVLSGVSKSGNQYRKCDVIFAHSFRTDKNSGQQVWETITLSLMNEKIDELFQLPAGVMLNVAFFSNAREYNGKYYNDFNVWKIQQLAFAQQPQAQVQPTTFVPPMQPQAPVMQAPQQAMPQQGGGFSNAPQGQGMAQANNGTQANNLEYPF